MPAIHVTNSQMKKILKNQNDTMISKNEKLEGVKMKNKLTDLNNYLFEQLERLNDDDLTDEQLEKEINRSKAVTNVAQAIVNNADAALKATKFLDDAGYSISKKANQALLLLGECDGEE